MFAQRAGRRAQQRLDLVRVEAGPRADQQGGGAGDDRGGLRGAGAAEAVADAGGGEGLVEEGAGDAGGEHGDAGGDDVRAAGGGAAAREQRDAVVVERRGAARVLGADGDHVGVIGGRVEALGVVAAVAGGHDDHEAVVPGALDGVGERIVAVGAVAVRTEGEVEDAHVEPVAVTAADGPVDAGQHAAERGRAVVVGDLDVDHARLRGDRADDAGQVRPVPEGVEVAQLLDAGVLGEVRAVDHVRGGRGRPSRRARRRRRRRRRSRRRRPCAACRAWCSAWRAHRSSSAA